MPSRSPSRTLIALSLPLVFGAAAVAAVLARAPVPAVAQPAAPAAPVLVELYQSEGCSSCPPAEAWLNRVADRPGLVALSFEVTYWDHLGWKDRFARPEYTQRQRDYAQASGNGQVATPQFWINGRTTVVGANPGRVEAAIAEARPAAPVPVIAADAVSVPQGAKPQRPAQVWLVRYDPRVVEVPVKAGENNGRTLPHKNLVRDLVLIGEWNGAAARFRTPAAPAGLATAVFLQDGRGGPVLSAARAG